MASKFLDSIALLYSGLDDGDFFVDNEFETIFEDAYLRIDKGQTLDSEKIIDRTYANIYNSFLLLSRITGVMKEIDENGMCFQRAQTLMDLCGILRNASTNVMISLDNDFQWNKKYSSAKDIVDMTISIYDRMYRYHSIIDDKNIKLTDPISLSKYDELEYKLTLKYIRNGLAVIRLFMILALFQVSPFYEEPTREIAKILVRILRDVLYNKRIIKVIVDNDTVGRNYKAHKTTRIKILFAMGNSDRYCIRVDFPHEGEESIHLNMNEPFVKQSVGFPFSNDEKAEVVDHCKSETIFDKLFFLYDELYWFKNEYISAVESFLDDVEKPYFYDFARKQGHLVIKSKSLENMRTVSIFAGEFAEALLECENTSYVYGDTSEDNDELYRLFRFQDILFDLVIRLQACDMMDRIHVQKNKACIVSDNNLVKLKQMVYTKVVELFPDATNLIEGYTADTNLKDYIGKCLDFLDQKYQKIL